MLDMGFLPSVKKIAAAVPASRQTLLFSATIDDAVRNSVGHLLHDPASVEVAHRGDTADTVEQSIVRLAQAAKPAALEALLNAWGADRVIVFARTRGRADSCARRLSRHGFSVAAIHSSKSQNQRRRALDAFAAGEVGVVVATDVLARGIDVSGVDYVVNYDMPTQPEDYVHRIGRTGRAGMPGRAVSFVTPETEGELKSVEKLIRRGIDEMAIDGFDAEQAEAEAIGRAQRAANRHDPEIAQAAKELKARKSRRAKAKAKERDGGKGPSKRDGAPNASKNAGAPNESGGASKPAGKAAAVKTASGQGGAKKGSGGKQPRHRNGSEAGSGRGQGQRHAKQAAKPKRDVRPGRAHRAAVAEQRRRKKM